MNTRQKLTLGIAAIFMVTLTIVGVTYAYFVTRVEGEPVQESVNVQTANVGDMVYKDVSGTVDFSNTLPGTTKYYHFSIANLGADPQSVELFLTEARAKSGYTDPKYTVDGVETTMGEFIHTADGTDTEAAVNTTTGCYGTNNKMSTQLTESDATYKALCFSEADGSKYNNFVITLYKLADTTPTNVSGDSSLGTKTFDLATNVFADIDYATALKDSGEGANKVTTAPSKVLYAADTTLIDAVTVPGETVYSYVLKVEYVKNALVQNAENLASLKLQASIR